MIQWHKPKPPAPTPQTNTNAMSLQPISSSHPHPLPQPHQPPSPSWFPSPSHHPSLVTIPSLFSSLLHATTVQSHPRICSKKSLNSRYQPLLNSKANTTKEANSNTRRKRFFTTEGHPYEEPSLSLALPHAHQILSNLFTTQKPLKSFITRKHQAPIHKTPLDRKQRPKKNYYPLHCPYPDEPLFMPPETTRTSTPLNPTLPSFEHP